jgi:hypothetical protein
MGKYVSHSIFKHNNDLITRLYLAFDNDEVLIFNCFYQLTDNDDYNNDNSIRIREGRYFIIETFQYRGNRPFLPRSIHYKEALRIFKVLIRKEKLKNLQR